MHAVEQIAFDKDTERELRNSLEQLHKKGAALGYYQLQGLLFAINCSPEKIQASEWFDLIWLNDDPQFDDKAAARQFYQAVVGLNEHVAEMAALRRYLPFSAAYSDDWQRELAQWCDGLLMGHQYLEDLWLVALDDLNDPGLSEDIDASLCLACTFADPVRAKNASFEQGIELTDDHLPEAYTLFRKVLATYASIKDTWSLHESLHAPEGDLQTLFDSLEPVPADRPCPCGSGVVFAKCCLH
jgi:uncharacterized protein